jgi:bacillithiol biosynthesis cysteine-adding enzyme BshC
VLLPADPFLPPLARRLLDGVDRDLLHPLRFVSGAGTVHPPTPDRARDRRALAASLRKDNLAFGHPRAAALADALARPETQVVVTGQQPGVFGGPLYTLVKAAAAGLWAEALERSSGRPAVAVFWIASDDHDFEEIARAYLPASGQAPARAPAPAQSSEPWLRLARTGGERDLRPVGPRAVGPEPRELLASRRAAAPSERYRRWLERLEEIYEPGATFTSTFARVLVALLGEHCPLLLDSASSTVKQLQGPVLSRILERESDLERALVERESEIAGRGLSLQVRPQPGCPPVFLLEEGKRLRLRRCDGGATVYELRGGALRADLDQLLGLLEREPERFSPAVLARPLLQDALLGTAVFLVGPGELGYLAQASALYEPAGVAPSAVALRPQALLLDRRRLEQVEDLAARGLGPLEILGDGESFEQALAALGGADPSEAGAAAVERALEELGAAVLALDPQLRAPIEKTREQVARALGTLRAKVRGTLGRRDEDTRRRALALRELLLPEGRLQERVVCVAHAAGLYGEGLGESMRARLDLDPGVLQLVCVDDGREPAESSVPVAAREAER